MPLRSPLQASEAFYVLHLSGVTPARPLTLDEARPKIVAAMKDERAKAAVAAKAEEIRSKIAEELKAGKPFADAAKDAGRPWTIFPASPWPTRRRRPPRRIFRTGHRGLGIVGR